MQKCKILHLVMVRVTGLEPARSYEPELLRIGSLPISSHPLTKLIYLGAVKHKDILSGVGDWNRTSIESFADFHITTLTHRLKLGAGYRNRTDDIYLEGCLFITESRPQNLTIFKMPSAHNRSGTHFPTMWANNRRFYLALIPFTISD